MTRTIEAVPQVATLACSISAVALAGCGLSLTSALLSIRLDAGGYTASQIGLNAAAPGIATLVGAPLVPWCARRFGAVALLTGSLCVTAAATAAFTLTAAYWVWMALRLIVGLGATVLFVTSEVWINAAASDRWRGLAIGVYVTSLAAGFAAGPLLLALTGAGDRAFLIGASIFLASTIPFAMVAGRTPALEPRRRPGLLRFVREIPVAAFAAALHGAIEIACLTLLPVFALRSGAGVERAALHATLFVVGGGLLQLPISALADRTDRNRLLLALAAAGCAGAAGLALWSGPLDLAFDCALVTWGGVVGAFYPVGLGVLGRRYGADDLADANAVLVMMYAAGMLAGPPIIGVGFDIASPHGLFWSLAAMIGAYLAFVVLWTMRHGSTHAGPAGAPVS